MIRCLDLFARHKRLGCVSNPNPSPVKARFAAHPVSVIGISAIVKAELLYGAHRSTRRTENLQTLATLFRTFPSIPFDDLAAEQYGKIRATLANQGTPIGPNDLLIAATALAYNLIVVTHNTREFGRVQSLKVEDWLADLPR